MVVGRLGWENGKDCVAGNRTPNLSFVLIAKANKTTARFLHIRRIPSPFPSLQHITLTRPQQSRKEERMEEAGRIDR